MDDDLQIVNNVAYGMIGIGAGGLAGIGAGMIVGYVSASVGVGATATIYLGGVVGGFTGGTVGSIIGSIGGDIGGYIGGFGGGIMGGLGGAAYAGSTYYWTIKPGTCPGGVDAPSQTPSGHYIEPTGDPNDIYGIKPDPLPSKPDISGHLDDLYGPLGTRPPEHLPGYNPPTLDPSRGPFGPLPEPTPPAPPWIIPPG
jgi:hypothetical protein